MFIRNAVMEFRNVFDCFQSIAFDGFCIQGARRTFGLFQAGDCIKNGGKVVSVAGLHPASECFQFLYDFLIRRGRGHNPGKKIHCLEAVAVDYDMKIVQMMKRGKLQGFPVGSLLKFPITDQTINIIFLFL